MDNLSTCLQKRIDAYPHVLELFACLLFWMIVDRLVAEYPNDWNSHLRNEILQIKLFFVESKSPFELLRSISDLGIRSTFPNIYVALKVIFTLHVTNCVGERSFSALARIKNKLRSSMTQMNLNSLALLSIESEFVKTIHNCYFRRFCNKEGTEGSRYLNCYFLKVFFKHFFLNKQNIVRLFQFDKKNRNFNLIDYRIFGCYFEL